MTEAERKNLEKELKELDERRLDIQNKLNGDRTISPNDVRKLIEMYHGHCFEFEDCENGAVTFIIDTFAIERDELTSLVTRVKISGTFVVYETNDSDILNLGKELYSVGGRLICSGSFDIDDLPGGDRVIDRFGKTKDTIFEKICKTLDGNEIDYDSFLEAIENADENYDYDGDETVPLGELNDFDKKRIYEKV